MPIMQVDKGAIKFVLSGANIMCPGFTSPGTYYLFHEVIHACPYHILHVLSFLFLNYFDLFLR